MGAFKVPIHVETCGDACSNFMMHVVAQYRQTDSDFAGFIKLEVHACIATCFNAYGGLNKV